MSHYHLYAIGNALVDTEYEVSDELLARMGVSKRHMTLIDGPRRSEKKTLIWTPWADVRDNTAQTREQTQERLQEGDLSLELRRCEMADTIRRHLFRHDRTYRVELDGDEYEVKTADFTRNDGGKIRFTASFTA